MLFYADGEKRYIIAPNGLQVGATLMSGENAAPEIGNALPLQNIPVGTVIHNIELRPGQGAALVRSAGNFAQLTSREGKYCVIKLPSGEVRQILSTCKATIGVLVTQIMDWKAQVRQVALVGRAVVLATVVLL